MALDTAAATARLRDLTAIFDNAVAAATPFYPEICTIRQSTGADEKYAWLGNMPGVREWLGDRNLHKLRAADYTLANKHWEQSLAIDRNDIEDDRMGMYGDVLGQLGDEGAYHPDELFLTALTDGEATACWDGQFFFDTDHAWGDSGTQSNDLTYDAADPNALTLTEAKAIYNQARTAMLGFKNDQGKYFQRPIVSGLSRLVLLVPNKWEVIFNEAMQSVLIDNGRSNVVLDTPRIVAAPGLGTTSKCYLFNTGQRLRPLLFQARKPLMRQMKYRDDIEWKDAKFFTEARYNMGYLAWWNAVLTTVT